MEDEKRSETLHAVEVMKSYFFERLFSIHYQYLDKETGRSRFEIASGFCTVHKGIPFFVTCAHFMTGLGKKIDNRTIQRVSIGVPCKPNRLLGFDLDDDYLAAFKYWDSHSSQDFAVGPCDEELQKSMIVGDAKLLDMNPIETSFEDKGMYFLFGYSAEDSKAKVNDLFYVPTEDGHRMLHSTSMGAFAPRFFQISQPTVLDDGRLESTLLHEDVASVKGLSGGFVVKIFPGKQLQQFEFIGIQSEQSTLNDRVTKIRYSLSEVVIECLDYFVETLSVEGESK